MSKRFVLLLLFFVHLVTSSAILTKRRTADSKERIVKDINERRIKHAKENNIGNMPEVSYDSDLEKIALEMSKGCKFDKGNHVFVNYEDEVTAYFEALNPLQTQVVCVDLTVPCTERKVEKGFCLFGPSGEAFSKKLFKTGPLGSHCSHGTADNGLCKAGPKNGSNSQLNFWIFAVIAAFVIMSYLK
ncbi:hypothetical protein CAEBREN_03483 [Caenorhabditis brenneri]|uniref:Uncharacterized protein n=1 Tax=Caenorhabditis brenneri TaxID=135651 RepID=G0N2H2_CAEBE|nr:hypothetical protein CAEBREN_03483 [Caenorhabditis brenneri]